MIALKSSDWEIKRTRSPKPVPGVPSASQTSLSSGRGRDKQPIGCASHSEGLRTNIQPTQATGVCDGSMTSSQRAPEVNELLPIGLLPIVSINSFVLETFWVVLWKGIWDKFKIHSNFKGSDILFPQDCQSILKLEKIKFKITKSYLSNPNSTFSVYLKVSVN